MAVARVDAEIGLLLRNSSWVFGAELIRLVLTLLKSVVIARGLGVELYGAFVMMTAFIGIVIELFNLNVGYSVVKFGAEFRSEGRLDKLAALLVSSAAASAALALLSVGAVAVLIGLAYERLVQLPNLGALLLLYAAASSLTLFDSISQSALRLFYRFRFNAMLSVIVTALDVLVTAVVVLAAPAQMKPFFIATIITTALGSLVVNAAAVYEVRPLLQGQQRASWRVLRPRWREIAGFAVANSLSRSVHIVISRGDLVLLGLLSSQRDVGLYHVAKKLAYTLLRITDPLRTSIFPQIATLVAEQRIAELRSFLRKITFATAAGGACVFVGAVVAAPTLLARVYGAAFTLAAGPFYFHLAAAVGMAALFWTPATLMSLGSGQLRLALLLVSALVGTLLALLLTPRFGAAGMAGASFVVQVGVLVAFAAASLRIMETRTQVERVPAC